MDDFQHKDLSKCNRRDFLKLAGVSAAGLSMQTNSQRSIKEVALPPLRRAKQTQFETDVLVVGGGYAGVFAALKAADKGQRVLVVDKGIVGKSGYSPWANTFRWFDASFGDNYDAWLKGMQQQSEYSTNLDYLKMWLNDSRSIYDDLLSWGAINPTQEPWNWGKKQTARKYAAAHFHQDRHLIMRKKLVESGIPIVERVMLTDLLTQDGRVVGALGFWMESEEVMVFRAKATILCTGKGSYKPVGYPTGSSTFDGDAMAYRIGASIGGKEYVDFHGTNNKTPGVAYKTWGSIYLNRIIPCGDTPIPRKRDTLGMEVHKINEQGFAISLNKFPPNPPTVPEDPRKGLTKEMLMEMFAPHDEIVHGAATGMGNHMAEGIFPVDSKCFSGIPGLYAAGEALASMLCGATYSGGAGTASNACAVQGKRAAEAAAEYAAQAEPPRPSLNEIARATKRLMAPLKQKKGFDPRWLNDVLHTTMAPYYILYIKEKSRLEGVLENIKFMREYLTGRLRATNPHELRLCHELENMVLNAEMKVRASLMRTESRGSHYRQDYPARNDKEWLAWILIKQAGNGKMTLTKKAMPKSWVGDLNVPYTERYLNRFPGELKFLGLPSRT